MPSAHRVCVNSCRKLHPSGQARGAVTAAGGVRAKAGPPQGIGRRKTFRTRHPRSVGALREEGSSVPRGLARFGGSCRRCDRERQRRSRPAPALPNKQGGGHRPSRGSTQREGERGRSWCRRRPIATPPGVENAGNGISAPAASSALPARVSARVKGELGGPRVTSAQAQGSGFGRSVGARDNWSAAEIVKGHLVPSGVHSSGRTRGRRH